jgi:hypothetical protein
MTARVPVSDAAISGIRVLNPTIKRWPGWADIFPNIYLMPKVKCLTTIMHVGAPLPLTILSMRKFPELGFCLVIYLLRMGGQGSEDEVIDISHGKQLHQLASNTAAPLWLEGYNHQNLEASVEYLPHLRRFLLQVPSAAQLPA